MGQRIRFRGALEVRMRLLGLQTHIPGDGDRFIGEGHPPSAVLEDRGVQQIQIRQSGDHERHRERRRGRLIRAGGIGGRRHQSELSNRVWSYF